MRVLADLLSGWRETTTLCLWHQVTSVARAASLCSSELPQVKSVHPLSVYTTAPKLIIHIRHNHTVPRKNVSYTTFTGVKTIQAWTGIRTHDLRYGAVLYQLNYQDNWELFTSWVRNIHGDGKECKWIYERYIWTSFPFTTVKVLCITAMINHVFISAPQLKFQATSWLRSKVQPRLCTTTEKQLSRSQSHGSLIGQSDDGLSVINRFYSKLVKQIKTFWSLSKRQISTFSHGSYQANGSKINWWKSSS